MKMLLSSIRAKMTLALLFVGLFSIVTVGLLSRTIMLDRFNDLVVAQAAKGFVGEVGEYYQAYGSWERARNTEPFFMFLRRIRPQTFNSPPPGSAPNRPVGDRNDGPRPGAERNFVYGGQPPPFVVTDELGQIELPLARGTEVGELVTQEQLDRAIPITVDGSVIGLAVPEQRFEISNLETQYLQVFERSWFISLILACGVALLLGWYFGRRLTHPILQLKWSMDAMRNGELKHELAVTSSDELGRLTEIFNGMSDELARSHKELEQSHRELEATNRLLSEYSNWLAAENTKKK